MIVLMEKGYVCNKEKLRMLHRNVNKQTKTWCPKILNNV